MEPAGRSTDVGEELRRIGERLRRLEQGFAQRGEAECDTARLVAMDSALGWKILESQTLADTLDTCVRAMVQHLDAALARIWILEEPGTLVLRASAGLYEHLDGPHGRVPVGRFKIGRIANERLPHLTNQVIGDPRVHDQEWARREGLVAFAGYPLVFNDQLIGVVAMFARKPLSRLVLQAIGSVADRIASAIDRVRAQEALRQSEARYRALFDRMAEGFALHEIICDPQGVPCDYRFIDLNPAFERLTGLRREDVIGRTVREILPEEDPKWIRIYGEVVLTGRPIHFNEYSPTLKRHYDVLSYRPDRGHFAVLFTDITERKQSEDRLREAQKAESIGLLAGGVAHEFNNILTSIVGNASLALDRAGPRAREMLTTVIEQAERAAQLTARLLAYSGKGRFIIRELDLSTAVREISDLLRVSVAKQIEIRMDLQDGLPNISMDPGQLQQLILNLVTNANEAIGNSKRGVITVSTGLRESVQPFPDATTQEMASQRYVCLQVQDTGGGMDDATKSRIFEPFFTTKFTGRGLGLAAVSGIVRTAKGGITVDTAPGRGTTFSIYLPAVENR